MFKNITIDRSSKEVEVEARFLQFNFDGGSIIVEPTDTGIRVRVLGRPTKQRRLRLITDTMLITPYAGNVADIHLIDELTLDD